MSFAPLLLTLQLIAVSVPMAAVIGIVGAWAASVLQSSGRSGRVLARLFLLSMIAAVAMPLVLHAAAWEATAGKFGWWTMTQTGARTDDSGVYGVFSGLLACGWIHGAFGAAIVGLATWHGARQTPRSVIEQAQLDIGPVAQWWTVRLPIASPWLIASLLATATVAATEMTVVDLYGYRTIADTFYLYNTVDPSLTDVLWTCVLPSLLAAASLIWFFTAGKKRMPVQTEPWQSSETEPASIVIKLVCSALVVLVIAAVVFVPILGLIVKVGHEVTIENGSVHAVWSSAACWERLIGAPRLFAAEYYWTALIGVVTGLTALTIAWPLAMFGRSRRGIERAIDIGTISIFVIPGPIIGMAVVHFFQLSVPSFRMLYGQTIAPTVVALLVRAVPVSYWVLRSGYRGIGNQVLDTARLDLAFFRRLRSVDLPLLGRHLILALLASSLFASGDVPATLPVIPAGVTTVGTRLFELLHGGARYQEASLAIWYVAAVVILAFIFSRQSGSARDSKSGHPS